MGTQALDAKAGSIARPADFSFGQEMSHAFAEVVQNSTIARPQALMPERQQQEVLSTATTPAAMAALYGGKNQSQYGNIALNSIDEAVRTGKGLNNLNGRPLDS